MSFFGLAFALLMVAAGLIAWRWPELISSYSMMSRKELANVDLKAAGRTSLVTMCATAVAVLALYYPLYYTGHYTLAIELSIVAVFAGCIALVYALRKYDRNPGRKKGTVAVAVTAVVAAVVCIMLFSWSRPVQITVENGAVEFSGAYGMTVPGNRLRSVSVMETLPEIELRTNGIGMGNIQTGHFRLEGTGPCRLYVNLRFSPFVQLVLDDGEIIIFNTSEKDRTMELYESCVELCMSGTAGTGEIEE